MKVICVRFNSGEEIIGKVVDSFLNTADLSSDTGPWASKGHVMLDTVRGITLQQVSHNQLGIAFVPWAVGNTETSHLINLDHAHSTYLASNDIEKGYLEQTSGIQLASATPSHPSIRM